MSAPLLLASLALALARGAPSDVDVVVLSRHRPDEVRVGGGCQLEGTRFEVRTLRATGEALRACDGAGVCRALERARLSCREDALLELKGRSPRRYGRALRARAREGQLRLIATLPLEDYVAGVVTAELAGAPPAALEAQAVLARTYAARAVKEPRHKDAPLCDLTHCQVFAGRRNDAAEEAARRTRGRLLVDAQGEPAAVFFHSTCGGRTLPGDAVWPGLGAPALVGISDEARGGASFCAHSPHFTWATEVEEPELARALAPLVGRALEPSTTTIEPGDEHGTRFFVGDEQGRRQVTGAQLLGALGRALGWSRVKSTRFEVHRAGRWLRFTGRGLGHRVGLCQHGAIARARGGQSADQILRAYFPRLRSAGGPR